MEDELPSTTRVLVYEYLRHHRPGPVRADAIATFFGIDKSAVSDELLRLEELRAVTADRDGTPKGYTLKKKETLRAIPAIRDLERGLPNFKAKLHSGSRLGPKTQSKLHLLQDFGQTDAIFK